MANENKDFANSVNKISDGINKANNLVLDNANKINDWYSKNITDVQGCFAGKNNSRRYNIHCYNNSTTLNTLLTNDTKSIVNATITWTKRTTYYYNTAYNIRIYPDL